MGESTTPGLPVHPVPELPDSEYWPLTLSDGQTRVTLDREAVAALAHTDLVDSFACLEGWTAGPLAWRGVCLAELLALLPNMASGPYLAVSAPDTCAVIALSDLPAESMLADTLNGAPLPREHGGPYRLVVPGGVCFESVKWVQQIERCNSTERDNAQTRARRRLAGAE